MRNHPDFRNALQVPGILQKPLAGWSVVVISICVSIFKIILSAFCGYHAGFSQEAHEENIISAKSAFLGEFLESENMKK